MSDIVLFGKTQSALGTPFASPPDRANAFTSKDVQNAIEEAVSLAIANDRFLVLASYGGNANTGRFLEIFPGQASDASPIYFSAASKLLTITLQTTAANATCTVGIFDYNVSTVTPVYTVVMSAQKRVQYIGSASVPLATLSAGALVVVKVLTGAINAPTMQLTLSAST